MNPAITRRADLLLVFGQESAPGFLSSMATATSLVRGRNAVDATLREATAAIDKYLSKMQ